MSQERTAARAGMGPRTTHQYVYERLREAITRGELRGGARLIQNEIAEQYGVSTTPVREALRDLATEGLIRLDPHRGAVVHQVEPREFDEIYELRMALEPIAMRKCVERITPEEIELVESIQDLAENETDGGKWVELNRRFHGVLVEATRLPRLIFILQMLRDNSSLYVGLVVRSHPSAIEEGNKEHREIITACKNRDVETAVQLIRAHLGATWQAAMRQLPEHDGHV